MTARPPTVRDDLAMLAGYHSPQLDVTVRLNTNEAPVGPPEQLTRELVTALESLEWNRYPDRSAIGLRQAIAGLHDTVPQRIFAANGSNEVLYTALHAYGGAGRRVLTFEPTYALHGHLARLAGTEVVEAERQADFTLDPHDAVAVIAEVHPDIVFCCSPNNPTGMTDPPGTVNALLEAVEASGGLLIVDEAYGQFAQCSALDIVDDGRNLLVTRTFSKTWSMAALRLGYAVGPAAIIAELHKVSLPYHLDAFTQAAGRLALGHVEAMEQRVTALVAERERLVGALVGLDVDVFPSSANFVLFRPRARSGPGVWQALVDRSVLVRDCSSWPRLDNCLRVTVGTAAEDDMFLDALAAALDEEGISR